MFTPTTFSLGRQFDKHGNLKQWWNNRTIGAFREAAQCIVDQYSGYTMQEINLNINGRMTQGENITTDQAPDDRSWPEVLWDSLREVPAPEAPAPPADQAAEAPAASAPAEQPAP